MRNKIAVMLFLASFFLSGMIHAASSVVVFYEPNFPIIDSAQPSGAQLAQLYSGNRIAA
jgi:hypothetical protein